MENEELEVQQEEQVEQPVNETETEDTSVNEVENENHDEVESEDEVDEPAKKSGKGFEKRIERFNRRLAEKDAEIEHWRKAALQSQPQQAPQTPAAPVQAMDKPQIGQFQSVEAYTEALTDWKLNQREMMRQQEDLKRKYEEKVSNVRNQYNDYDDVVSDLLDRYKNVNAPDVQQYLTISDKGPELYYYFGNNTAELDRILSLPPVLRVGELGKIEARLQNPSTPTKKVSRAPAPIQSEKGSAPKQVSLDDPNLSQAEYRQLRMAKRKRY